MTTTSNEGQACLLCRGPAADATLGRIQVWENELWRLTVSLETEVPGFSHLEPKRHVRSVGDLAGDEARSFGPVLARISTALRQVTNAEVVYIYIFGDDIDHLHVHLAPHQAGDALNSQMIRGELISESLPGGATRIISRDFPPLPAAELLKVSEAVKRKLSA